MGGIMVANYLAKVGAAVPTQVMSLLLTSHQEYHIFLSSCDWPSFHPTGARGLHRAQATVAPRASQPLSRALPLARCLPTHVCVPRACVVWLCACVPHPVAGVRGGGRAVCV